MQAVVQKWGNSLGFRIPSLWAKDNNVKNGSKIEVIAEKGKMESFRRKRLLMTCWLWSLQKTFIQKYQSAVRQAMKNGKFKLCS